MHSNGRIPRRRTPTDGVIPPFLRSRPVAGSLPITSSPRTMALVTQTGDPEDLPPPAYARVWAADGLVHWQVMVSLSPPPPAYPGTDGPRAR